VNQRERDLMARIHDGVSTIGALTPSNPMDIRAISHNLGIATKGAKRLKHAISNLGYGDYDLCAEELDEAEHILSRRPAQSDSTDNQQED
jgi:hypothetical protein